MIRKLLIVILLASVSLISKAQVGAFFKPLPSPHFLRLGGLQSPLVINSLRPIATVSATFSDGTQLAGGFGLSWQHNVYDASTDSYNTQYAFSGIGFLGTNGQKITGTAGLVISLPGTNGILGAGLGYDFTQQHVVGITSVQFKFN